MGTQDTRLGTAALGTAQLIGPVFLGAREQTHRDPLDLCGVDYPSWRLTISD